MRQAAQWQPDALPVPTSFLPRCSLPAVASLCDEQALEELIEKAKPQTAGEWAAVFSAELLEMERLLAENQVRRLSLWSLCAKSRLGGSVQCCGACRKGVVGGR